MSWKTRGCYLWRTRKPHARFGLPLRFLLPACLVAATMLHSLGAPWWPALVPLFFSGRHNAYVGQTSSRRNRDRQHLYGDRRHGAAGKDWSDLDPKCYPLPCLFPRFKFWREFSESAWILFLLPVYNVRGNKRNPRRITPAKAGRQRIAREKAERTVEGYVLQALVFLVRIAPALTFWGGIGWVMFRGF